MLAIKKGIPGLPVPRSPKLAELLLGCLSLCSPCASFMKVQKRALKKSEQLQRRFVQSGQLLA